MSALQLPALNVEAKAELLTNNLPEFEKAFRSGIEKMSYELLTDDDFKKAKEDIKTLKEAESTLKEVDEAIVNGSVDIKTLREAVATLSNEARDLRLAREKEVKKRDAEVKQEIIDEAVTSIERTPCSDSHLLRITNAIKSKRSIESIRTAANGESGIINMELKASREVIERFVDQHGKSIAPDADELELRSAKELNTEFSRRIERIEAEAEKKRMQEEHEKEQAKLRAEADEAKRVAELEKKVNQEAVKPTEVNEDLPPVTSNEPYAVPVSKSGNHFDSRPAAVTEANRGEEEELESFCKLVASQFTSIKEARLKLDYDSNNQKALKFAKGVNALFIELKGGA